MLFGCACLCGVCCLIAFSFCGFVGLLLSCVVVYLFVCLFVIVVSSVCMSDGVDCACVCLFVRLSAWLFVCLCLFGC